MTTTIWTKICFGFILFVFRLLKVNFVTMFFDTTVVHNICYFGFINWYFKNNRDDAVHVYGLALIIYLQWNVDYWIVLIITTIIELYRRINWVSNICSGTSTLTGIEEFIMARDLLAGSLKLYTLRTYLSRLCFWREWPTAVCALYTSFSGLFNFLVDKIMNNSCIIRWNPILFIVLNCIPHRINSKYYNNIICGWAF